MIASVLLLCQLVGEVIVRGFALPMPGPVVGLMLLLLLLLARDRFAPLARGMAAIRKFLYSASRGRPRRI